MVIKTQAKEELDLIGDNYFRRSWNLTNKTWFIFPEGLLILYKRQHNDHPTLPKAVLPTV